MPQSFELTSYTLGALPIVQHYLERLRIEQLLAQYVPDRDRRALIPHHKLLAVLLRNIVLGRRPLYALREWAEPYEPSLLGLDAASIELLNDDRAGRALDRLFDADRASLMTAVVVRAVMEFDVELEQLHNDSTSITFSGRYSAATGRRIRGKRAAAITQGYNKDHRPDLKQLLWILTVSADGSVPVHYRVCDGNSADDPTHIQTWETLHRLVGRPDFLYIADCKLCTKGNMGHIHRKGGRFICVLPRSRKEDPWFRHHIQEHEPAWEEAIRKDHPRRKDGPDDTWYAVEAPMPSAEGFRVVWVWSVLLAESHQRSRQAALHKVDGELEALNRRLQGKRCRLRDRASVEDVVESILKSTGTERWVQVQVHEDKLESFKQAGPGRPGPNTRYVRVERSHFRVSWQHSPEAIEYDARSDGMYPLITNHPDLSAAEVLRKHKQQPLLEKRHQQIKSVYAVAPALLKNEGRIEALLLLYFLAMLVQSLIERQVRRAMQAKGIKVLPLYPEQRDCRAPTTTRLLEVFEGLQRHVLRGDGVVLQSFSPQLSQLQRELLALLDVPPTAYP